MIELEGLEAVPPLPAVPPMIVVPPAAPPAGTGPLILVVINIHIWKAVYDRVAEYNRHSEEISESEKRIEANQPRYDAADDIFVDAVDKYGPSAGLTIKEMTELVDLNHRSLDLDEYERGRYTNLQKKLKDGAYVLNDATNSEKREVASDANKGRNRAQELTGLGSGSLYYRSRLGGNKGKVIGLQSGNGKIRYRYDLDEDGNFHINVEDFSQGKGGKGSKTRIDLPGGKGAYDSKIKELNR